MYDSCGKHPHELGVAICRRCGGSWCSACLVYTFGPKKPPYCLGCAMVAGGVRSASSMPALPRKELKARMKEMKRAAKVEAKAAAAAAKEAVRTEGEGEPAPSEEQEKELQQALSATDWSTPWWEDRQPTMAD